MGMEMNDNFKGTVEGAMEKIVSEVKAGLRHGHFEIKVEGEIITGNKRRLIIRAGKSHKFIIDAEDATEKDS